MSVTDDWREARGSRQSALRGERVWVRLDELAASAARGRSTSA